jgi:phospholipase A-2-activating protein
VLEGH